MSSFAKAYPTLNRDLAYIQYWWRTVNKEFMVTLSSGLQLIFESFAVGSNYINNQLLVCGYISGDFHSLDYTSIRSVSDHAIALRSTSSNFLYNLHAINNSTKYTKISVQVSRRLTYYNVKVRASCVWAGLPCHRYRTGTMRNPD